MTDSATESMSVGRRQTMSDCKAAAKACIDAATYCEGQGGRYCENDRVRMLRACADLCERTATSLQDGTEPDQPLGEQCAEMCARVAMELASVKDDARMQECSVACLRCASSLKQLATPAGVDYDAVVADSFPASDPPAEQAQI